MTELETLYTKALYGDENISESETAHIRQIIHRTAHHEAAHYVARYFTVCEVTHVVNLTVVPQPRIWGSVASERNFARRGLATAINQWADGMQLLLMYLAGPCMDIILEPPEELGWDNLHVYCCENGDDDDESSDYFRACEVAEVMAKRYMPAHRVFFFAEKWTREMLHIAKVRETIEKLAAELITRSEFTGNEAYDIAHDIGCPYIYQNGYSKWRRRLFRKADKELRTGPPKTISE